MNAKLAASAIAAIAILFVPSVSAVAAPEFTPATQSLLKQEQGKRGGRMIQKIEAELGQPLSMGQKQELAAAAKAMRESMQPARDNFWQQVSSITGIPANELQEMVKQNRGNGRGSMLEQLEAKMGQSLTEEQKNEIRGAREQLKQAAQPARQEFTQQVSQITGLSVAQLDSMFSKRGGNRAQ